MGSRPGLLKLQRHLESNGLLFLAARVTKAGAWHESLAFSKCWSHEERKRNHLRVQRGKAFRKLQKGNAECHRTERESKDTLMGELTGINCGSL